MYIDLSRCIQDGMPVYPGDLETTLVQTSSTEQDGYTNHQLTINMHAGTHIDGPMHLTTSGEYLNDFPLEAFIGEGCLLDVSGEAVVDYKAEYEEWISRPGQIVVLHTGHSQYFHEPSYYTDHPVLTAAFADFLIRKQVKMIALDTPSPDKDPFEVHKKLFSNRILIAENLTNVEKLLHVPSFEIIALPLHIRADSSPSRVIARIK